MQNYFYSHIFYIALQIALFSWAVFPNNLLAQDQNNTIVDSAMTIEEALEGVNPECPESIKMSQRLIDVRYYSFDGRIHQGQILIHAKLEEDIKHVFDVALLHRFPFESVIPVADERFLKDGQWSDEASMAMNNTSGFNYRTISGGGKLSKHAYGAAIDINPLLNPYIKGDYVLPPQSQYVPDEPGTLHKNHPVVIAFKRLGWVWGGDWKSLKDYQHFEKRLDN